MEHVDSLVSDCTRINAGKNPTLVKRPWALSVETGAFSSLGICTECSPVWRCCEIEWEAYKAKATVTHTLVSPKIPVGALSPGSSDWRRGLLGFRSSSGSYKALRPMLHAQRGQLSTQQDHSCCEPSKGTLPDLCPNPGLPSLRAVRNKFLLLRPSIWYFVVTVTAKTKWNKTKTPLWVKWSQRPNN